MKLLLMLFGGILLQVALAVDRSKFRTCQQTSFCRRHRNQHSESLYRYKLLKDSIKFHHGEGLKLEQEEVDGEAAEAAAGAGGGGSMWKSLQRRLLGQDSDHDTPQNDDHQGNAVPPPTLTGTLINTSPKTGSGESETLQLTVFALVQGMARLRITETYGKKPNTAYETPRVTYNHLVLESEMLSDPSSLAANAKLLTPETDEGSKLIQAMMIHDDDDDASNFVALQYGDATTQQEQQQQQQVVLLIQLDPFVVSMYRSDSLDKGPIVVLGAQDMMHFEVRRYQEDDKKDEQPAEQEKEEEEAPKEEEKEIVGYWEDGLAIYSDGTREEKKEETTTTHRQLTELELSQLDREGLWEEKFSSHTDSKPFGPMSVGMDIAFPTSTHLYGIPEHASSAVLQTTLGEEGAYYKEPYRLYNLDVFEYELDETMALYGHVPLIMSQSLETLSVGVFWFNPTETFVDVIQQEDSQSTTTTTHWMSESGILDIFLLPGPNPQALYRQYAQLTGTTPLPPMFSLGYHQCRWNYKDENDVYQVHGKFEELDYPYDVLWLDIEHTNGKRYFTWDSKLFPDPVRMQEKLASQGRRMVTIIDPHIKRDDGYYIHKEATNKGLYIKDKNGINDYDGWCWPGSSSYLDFTAAHVRQWWAEQFTKYRGSTPTLFTWNDMNEPSVFNGPEVSMQKDLLNLQGQEHREWHNLYGMLFHRATMEGQIHRSEQNDVRPFVLSRAFFAASQRYGAIWTGDNAAEWGHLQIAAPMLLSLNVAALSFVGADVGGFFGNPDAELFVRWMQAGAYQPFFRGHAHHDSKRREPWMFDDDTLQRLRQSAMERYALLPYWYTVFRQAETTGMPVMRMLWMQYPNTAEELLDIDDAYLIGSDLLVKPVTQAGVSTTQVTFPSDHAWYDVRTLQAVPFQQQTPNSVVTMKVPSPIDIIPVFQRGGSILARKLRLRRSTVMMKTDPYTLYVAIDPATQTASGSLYMDDEESFGYTKRQEYAQAEFDYKDGVLKNTVTIGAGWHDFDLAPDRMIERIVIMGIGIKKPPTSITVDDGAGAAHDCEFIYNDNHVLTIRKPEVSALLDWTMHIV